MGTRLVRARLADRPHTLSHLVTARCNGSCATCLWRDLTSAELDTSDVVWLYEQAGRLGMAQLVVWGGEPLLRQDLPELLLAARRAGLFVTLITNGWFLAERWPELRGLVDALILSLDDVGEAHDRLRGLPGLYERLEAFVDRLRGRDGGRAGEASPVDGLDRRGGRAGEERRGAGDGPTRPTLLVNTVLSRLNECALERVAPVARRWGAGLYFCPMETGDMTGTGFVERHGELALPADRLRAAALQAAALKSAGYPILATPAYLELVARDPEVRDYVCRAPHALLTVEADGSVRDCRRSERSLARIDELRASGRSLRDVLALPRRRALVAEATACTKCSNADIVELSWLWDLRPTMVAKVAQLMRLPNEPQRL